jgi:hypothetical protein
MIRLTVGLTLVCNLALAGHFLRDGTLVGVVLTLAATVALWSHQKWAVLLNMVTLGAGSLMWLSTAGQILARRQAEGKPYQRMLAILASVAAVSLLTAVLWAVPKVRHAWLRPTPAAK